MPKKDLHEANRLSWNAATRAHNSHKGDQARFLREGGSTLFPEELDLLGELRGRSLLHLQCNSGQDTLSLAARGAHVTGVDISDEAIDFARRLSAESGLSGTFERSDVYDWLASAPPSRFDLVFCSYGVTYWLSDLKPWAEGISRVLQPGGRFVLVEFHPVLWLFDEKLRLTYPYGGGHRISEASGVGDYVALSGEGLVPWGYEEGVRDFRNPHPCHGFQWGLGDVINPLLRHGLMLERLEEYCYANGWNGLEGMRETPGRRYLLPEGVPELPLMFGLSVRKAG
ncbi:class I SAM-dependent methyltransferase [Archangium sp.]|uniref:class I SAM-dependent methyltransferase n=1 Tax=Archangium sp. TaxID=1872627 RepID=UPI002D3087A4|nr:class I SAM-dependent methyltransferase [Archangium sp.]HYO57322.1 class I SAM-dependent methyltransferase [Archangium sp.]